MKYLQSELNDHHASPSPEVLSTLQRAYRCICEHLVFFRDRQCSSCDTQLGYEPNLGCVVPLIPAGENASGMWRISGSANDTKYRRCQNLDSGANCNWLTDADHRFCMSCRLNRTIPNLSSLRNEVLWSRIETAKRRVISSLIALGLPVVPRSENPKLGLAFDLLSSAINGERVITGHRNGLITLNIEEADDVRREEIRTAMHEPYRTLVGHFRHEVGHYYWFRLIADSEWISGFRSLFGDEREDYSSALERNYEDGPPADWKSHFVSAYASIHPWEDWAETWAHYMHMADTLATATSLGVRVDGVAMPFDPFSSDALYTPEKDDFRFLSFLNSWLKLAAVLNELSRSMGQPEFYPFALPRGAVSKLHFVHILIRGINRHGADSELHAAQA